MKTLFIFATILFFNPVDISTVGAQTLFKIGRSKDINEIFYKVNTDKNGGLIKANPIDIYWIKYTDNNKREPLNRIQQNYAYGLKYISVTAESAVFQFVSYGKRNLVLKKNTKGLFKVYTVSGKSEVELQRIYVQMAGGSFWNPVIKQVELYTINAVTQKVQVEIITP